MFNIRTQAACAGPGSDLVSTSAFCSFDSVYASRIIPISTHSRIWWCRIAICFVLGCEDGF